ncbi:hypothetical protein SPRG_12646 [Saprolegnia parasitica CBS 223.65]|uniref:Uncharacterized protein n=1 Tax=Saprolegnia parasitica (strain CBS 223.65) TaxID=695850 RepID=A0A067C4U8_SAPPC|nr:hypothetical protein SPRG_12646 [Saprolegnia parasitica CBS 223.65]KDO21832.1 hypothetical protein SPRG_12646 [Saprolegnia parasitica CBS 223.65]|eukprot:XP_012207505.1 hypothetical protein SPRG_12646 [Saprolegnia parasitica CBS 223.65]
MWQPIVIGVLLALVFVGAVAVGLKQRHSPPPRALLCFRYLCLAFYLVVLVAQWIKSGFAAYNFYTFWNFNLQAVYFAWTLLACVVGSVNSRGLNTLFDVVFANSFVVAAVFWGVLYSPKYGVTWLQVAQHGVNSVLLLLEFALNDFSVQPRSLIYASFLLPDVFAAFAWVARECWLDYWVYSFLNVYKVASPLWYVGMLLGHCLKQSVRRDATELASPLMRESISVQKV